CAVIHVWYVELLDEMISALQACGIRWRIIITTTPDRTDAVQKRMHNLGLSAEIIVADNQGRDILPFLRVADRLVNEGSGPILKLHTKRSTHRRDGDSWRRDLLERLLSPQRMHRILDAFASDESLGLVTPEGHVQPLHYFWGANRDNVDYLTQRLGIAPPDPQTDLFVAGSMFWVRPSALRPLLDAHLDTWEFEAETGQVDGTFAHAV